MLNAPAVGEPARGGAACRNGPRQDQLDDDALVSLQLLVRGYTIRQIAALRGVPSDRTNQDLRGAAEALGASTLADAAAEARR